MRHTTHTQKYRYTQTYTDIIFTFYTFWLIWHTCQRYKFYIWHTTDLHMYRHSDMHTHRHTHVQRHRHTDTYTETSMFVYKHTYIHTNVHVRNLWKLLVQIHLKVKIDQNCYFKHKIRGNCYLKAILSCN